MAASKPAYKIPYGLAQSYGDMTIALQSKDGSVGKVVPMVFVLSYIISALSCLFCVSNTFIGSAGNMVQIVLFVLLWAALTVVLTSYDGTHRMNLQRIMTLLNYLPKKARRVFTRLSNDAIAFWNILGIEDIREDGLVIFSDGTFGYWYRVVGSASILLFDSDKDAIITRVDNFYRKWECDSEIVFMTTKEAQKVYRQIASLKRRYENLRNDDPDLRDLAEEQFRILKDYVGSEFKSIHQYMLIKSDNKEALLVGNNILQSEVENSSLMIKQCVPLDMNDTYEVLKTVYQKGDFNGNKKKKPAGK